MNVRPFKEYKLFSLTHYTERRTVHLILHFNVIQFSNINFQLNIAQVGLFVRAWTYIHTRDSMRIIWLNLNNLNIRELTYIYIKRSFQHSLAYKCLHLRSLFWNNTFSMVNIWGKIVFFLVVYILNQQMWEHIQLLINNPIDYTVLMFLFIRSEEW